MVKMKKHAPPEPTSLIQQSQTQAQETATLATLVTSVRWVPLNSMFVLLGTIAQPVLAFQLNVQQVTIILYQVLQALEVV